MQHPLPRKSFADMMYVWNKQAILVFHLRKSRVQLAWSHVRVRREVL